SIGNTVSGWFNSGPSAPAAAQAATSASKVASGAGGTDWGGILGGVAGLAGSFLSARNGGGGMCCDGGSPVVKTLRTIESTIKIGNQLFDTGNKIQDALARNLDAGEFGKKGLSLLEARLTGTESLKNLGANSQAAQLAAQTSWAGNDGAELTREALAGVQNTTNILTETAESIKNAFSPVTKMWDSATGKISAMMTKAEVAVGDFVSETWASAKSAMG
ncbi:MAG: hypothetical protein GY862_23225, partial [Gammaproteobacteria bacterium]|nr:hypothetical protein [Gammaproteobacteria bacterium]